MSGTHHEQVKEIFFQACLRPQATRDSYLNRACSESVDLRAEVDSLLAFYEGGDRAGGAVSSSVHVEPQPRFRRGHVLGGRFLIERLIGSGGMGEVYAAFDRVLGVAVALKTLRTADERHRARLYEEVRLTRQISHPGICRVYDIGEHEGTPFLSMELIVGEDLAARMERAGPFSPGQTAAIGARLGEALAAAHEAGILHRDLKPANILIDRAGGLHITDFGIASLRDFVASPEGAAGDARRMGTPTYMAPEAADPAGTPTEKADLYSMGLVLYELLTGAPPFDAPDPSTLREMHRSVDPERPSLTMPGLDPRLESWILRLLAKNPAARPSTAREVAAALAALDDDTVGPPQSHPPEHRPLTVLLYQIVGGATRVTPQDRELVTLLKARCAGICVQRGGRVAKQLERGLVVHFGYPTASEHDAENAVRAGVEILEEVRHSAAANGERSAAAIAVHAGTALFRQGRSGDVVISGGVDDLELLRRMLVPEEVVVSSATLPLLRQALISERLEAFMTANGEGAGTSLRIPERVRRGPGLDVPAASLTPFVGRDLELAQLIRHWEDARAGQGQVVLVSGEAGVGKSRLLHELWTRISSQAVGLDVPCRGFHRSSPLAPFLDLVQRAARLEDADDEVTRRRKLQALLAPVGARAAEISNAFGAWLARGGQAADHATAVTTTLDSRLFVRGLVDWILALAEEKPLVMVVDDLQWSDPTSLEALDLLVPECAGAPLLLILSFRPQLSRRRWKGARISPISLQPLRADEARRVMTTGEGAPTLSESTVERIIDSADGNPLFLEELVREAREAGFARSITRAEGEGLPLTLSALLQSRLDRLGPAKLVAQAGAACGRSFRHDLLAAIVGADRGVDLQDGLDRLHDEGLVYRRGAAPDAVYTFKQPLMREAINGAMPQPRKRTLHARVAELLPAIDPQGAATRPEVVANHWMLAGQPARSFPWWRQAAHLALQRSAFIEASIDLAHARRAFRPWVRATGVDPHQAELDLLIATLSAHAGRNRFVALEVPPILRRLRSVCRRIESGETLVLAHIYLLRFKVGASDTRGLLPLLLRTEALAARTGDPQLTATVRSQVGLFLTLQGRYTEAESYCRRCLESSVRATPKLLLAVAVDPRVVAAYAESLCRWARGKTAELERGAEAASAEADSTGHAFSRAYGRVVHGVPLLLAGAYDQASRMVSEGLELAQAREFPGVVAMGRLLEVLLESARGTAPAERLERAIAAWEANGQRHLAGVSRLVLASALVREGEHEKALVVLEEECRRAGQRLSRFPTPALHRRRGEVLARLGRTREAEAALRRALRLARQQGAFSIELGAAASLARLLVARNEVGAATRALQNALGDLDPAVDAEERTEAESLLAELDAASPIASRRLLSTEPSGAQAHREAQTKRTRIAGGEV